MQALDCTVDLAELQEGFISITDQSLEKTEIIKSLTVLNDEKITQQKLYCALTTEKVFYKVKWSGGGSLTVRCIK